MPQFDHLPALRILKIDLNKREHEWFEIPQDVLGDYLGGRGLGIRYLYDNLPTGIDPLGPENILTFWTSPVIGSGTISTVKICGVTKSPLTGTILMSLMGGYFGPELRFAGVDGLVLTGAANQPVYLLVKDGEVQINPAEHLWGLTTSETEKTLKEELGLKKMQVASIGPGGEKQVLFASIMHGGDAMGRGGIGAVMGSKNVKAIVASGTKRPAIHDPQRFKETLKGVTSVYKESMPLKLFGATGTTRHVDGLNAKRMYPTRNFQDCVYADSQMVNAEALYKNFVQKRVTCHACTVRCRRVAAIENDPQFGTVETEGPEYETLWGFGGNCDNNSLPAIITANQLCKDYGIDSISTGMVVSFAMECYENGLITNEQTNGLSLDFGNAESMVELISLIGKREGLGDLLALGSKRAAEQIGNGAEDFAMQVKGLELAGYDPRSAKGMGLGYATSPRGACHERGYLLGEVIGNDPQVDRLAYEGKGKLVSDTQDAVAVKDALGFCVLSSAGTSFEAFASLFSAATGIETQVSGLLQAGERICNLERLFNLREGLTRQDDTLPKRLVKEAIKATDGEMHTVDLERLLNDYYRARGWDEEGVPLPDTLARLGLPG